VSLALAIRYALLGMLAFICACVPHEAIGHGGACLATGGHIQLLTSVFFRCSPSTLSVDLAGTIMNLAVAGFAWWAFAKCRLSPTMRLFALFVFAFNAFWGAGYFIYSAVLDIGDLSSIWRENQGLPPWLWRTLLGAVGVLLYGRAMRVMSPHLPARIPLLIVYLSAGALAVISVTLARTDLSAAIREAVAESVLASAGLPYLALAPKYSRESNGRAVWPIAGWFTMAAVPIIAVFLLLLGRGLGPA
jgi:hypothetical protein